MARWATIAEALLAGLTDDAVSGDQWISDATPQLKALAATLRDLETLVRDVRDPGVRRTLTGISEASGAELAAMRATVAAVARSDREAQIVAVKQWMTAGTTRVRVCNELLKAVDDPSLRRRVEATGAELEARERQLQ